MAACYGLLSTPRAERAAGRASGTEFAMAEILASVLTGWEAKAPQEAYEAEVLEGERAALMRLARPGPTLDRMEHMLRIGRPLRI
jgi:hypothetical protein|tara:strand:- start:1037 stop:1291 length:255 start_codon:yes stop_codon:yes gene_type:complete